VSFFVLFLCKCVLYYCHRATTQLQLINISITIYLLKQKSTDVKNAATNAKIKNFCKEICRTKLKKRRNLLDQKPIPTKSQYGMESNICSGCCRGTKNDAKLERFWKKPYSKFLV